MPVAHAVKAGLASRIYPHAVISAVQDVNVVRDSWDWFFGWAGAVGGFAGAAALWYAARTRREVAEERARLFELEVIRELMSALDVALSNWPSAAHLDRQLKPYARRLSLLPHKEFPEFRRIVTVPDWYDQIEDEVGATKEKAEIAARIHELQGQGSMLTAAKIMAQEAESKRADRRTRDAVDALLWLELEEAAKLRAGANMPRRRRLRGLLLSLRGRLLNRW